MGSDYHFHLGRNTLQLRSIWSQILIIRSQMRKPAREYIGWTARSNKAATRSAISWNTSWTSACPTSRSPQRSRYQYGQPTTELLYCSCQPETRSKFAMHEIHFNRAVQQNCPTKPSVCHRRRGTCHSCQKQSNKPL